MHAIDDRGRGRDQVEVELAGQPLLDDLEMQQAEEAAAEAEAEGGRGLGLVVEAGIVEPQLAEAFAQFLEIVGVDREQAAPDDRHGGLEAGQRLGGGVAVVGDRVADVAVGHGLDGRGDVADLARAEIVGRDHLGAEHAHLLDAVGGAVRHHADALPAPEPPVLDAHEDDHAEIGVVPAIDQQRLERAGGIALGRRQARDERLQHALDVEPGLGADHHRVLGVEPDHVLDLLLHPLGLGGRQVDLVEHGHDLVVRLDRLVDVGQRLRLDALGGIDHEKGPLAGGEASAHLIGEIHMAGRVHQVELIDLPVLRLVAEADGLRLDGDAPLALELHVVEDLVGHLAVGERAGGLDQPVGQGGFPVVDMGDDREVADMVERRVSHGG